jgi:hypothetical protein
LEISEGLVRVDTRQKLVVKPTPYLPELQRASYASVKYSKHDRLLRYFVRHGMMVVLHFVTAVVPGVAVSGFATGVRLLTFCTAPSRLLAESEENISSSLARLVQFLHCDTLTSVYQDRARNWSKTQEPEPFSVSKEPFRRWYLVW